MSALAPDVPRQYLKAAFMTEETADMPRDMIPQPGSTFPKLTFPTVTVKVMIAVTFVCAGEADAEGAEMAITEALKTIEQARGNVAVNYERLP
jgi:hypothetical protein